MTQLAEIDRIEQSYLANIEAGEMRLAAAETDFERMQIASLARAGVMALKALGKTRLVRRWSLLAQRADRAISKANPRLSNEDISALAHASQRGEYEGKTNAVKAYIRACREVHEKLTDEQFETIAGDPDAMEPVTRASLKRFARIVHQQGQDDPAETEDHGQSDREDGEQSADWSIWGLDDDDEDASDGDEYVALSSPEGWEIYDEGDARDIADALHAENQELKEQLAATQGQNGHEDGEEEEEAKPHLSYGEGNEGWYTPAAFLDVVRETMGGIDLDPASHEHAQARIQAAAYFTKEDDGLAQDWHGRVYLNPPYTAGLVDKFADKLIAEYTAGRVTEAVWLTNNSADTGWFHRLAKVASIVVFLRGRVKFWGVDDEGNETIGTPLQGQVLMYLGSNGQRFAEACAQREATNGYISEHALGDSGDA